MAIPSNRWLLRQLPVGSRLVIAAFLISVGVGYVSALVQLHFQHATPGTPLPTAEDAVSVYHGQTGMTALEQLLVTDEGKPFNGSGSMRVAFTSKSGGWKPAISRRAKEKNIGLRQAEDELRSERDGERLVLLDWIRTGADQKAFEEDNHVLSSHLLKHPLTEGFVEAGPDGTKRVKVASIVEARCARCHAEGRSGSAGQFPLDSWEQIHEYCKVEMAPRGMSLKKLAQTTHVHLLGFAMLYGLTGLLVTFTSYPGWFRAVLGPLPLVAQVVDISFWWLGRMDPVYAQMIAWTGGVVALSLLLQIVLTLFNLFGSAGRTVLVFLLLAAGLGGYVVKNQVIDPYLAKEAMSATLSD